MHCDGGLTVLWRILDAMKLYNVVKVIYLDENLSYRDERSTELCNEHAADEEIPQSSSEELQIRHTNISSLYNYK